MGEDICDPYGGAFKATLGLSTLYQQKIYNTPISEAGIVGVGVGLALNGIIPIIEIMFGDFITLCFDQILNHAAKYELMYAKQKKVPLIIRTPMGGGRGYGPTHSQSLEKFLIGIPNINVIALSLLHDPIELFERIVSNCSSPTIIIEDKKSYGMKLLPVRNKRYKDFFIEEENNSIFPVIRLTFDPSEKSDTVIITYGSSLQIAIEAATRLMIEDEISVDILLNTSLSPLHKKYISQCVESAANIISLEDGTVTNGWGAEIVASLAEQLRNKKFARIAALDTILPCSKELEKTVLPDAATVISTIKGLIND
jgi:pyruvate/2-oxoglutarate/acetoin dehydrogenase E1 component